MKLTRLLSILAAGIFLAVTMVPGAAFGANASTTSDLNNEDQPGLYVYEVTFLADDADGSIDALVINLKFPMILVRHESDPGATAPTANWDYYLNDLHAVDVLGAGGEDRSATVSEHVIPTSVIMQSGNVTFTASGNSVNAANGVVKFFFLPIR